MVQDAVRSLNGVKPYGTDVDRVLAQGLTIAAGTSQFRERLIRCQILLQACLKDGGRFLVPESFSPVAQASVGCDFVVFDLLDGGEQCRIDEGEGGVTSVL